MPQLCIIIVTVKYQKCNSISEYLDKYQIPFHNMNIHYSQVLMKFTSPVVFRRYGTSFSKTFQRGKMKLRFYNLRRKLKVISSWAYHMTQFLASLIAIITVCLALLLRFQSWLIPISAFLFGIFVANVLVIIFSLKATPPRWILKGYKYVKIDSLYVVHADDLTHHTLVTEVEIEAIQSGINIFESSYRWTGRGREEEPKIISPGHTLLGTTIKQSGWKYYYIHLGQEMSLGARTTIKIVQELYDIDNDFEPFLGKVISVPMDYVILHVILPKSHLPKQIYFKEWDSAGPAAKIIRERPGKINDHSGEIRWEIPSPVFRHWYSINWAY